MGAIDRKTNGSAVRRRPIRTAFVVGMALVMVLSVVAVGAVGNEGVTDVEPVDEVYVDGDGNAVLVDESSAGGGEGELGIDVAEGIVYMLLTEEIEEDISAAFDLWVGPDGLESTGEMALDGADAIEDFSLDVSGVHTADENSFDAELDFVADTGDGAMTEVENVDSWGESSVGPDSFTTTGTVVVEDSFAAGGPEEGFEIGVAGTSGDYVIDAHEARTLAAFEVDQWETEADAQATLEGEFAAIAEEFGGEAEVTIHTHNLDESGDRPLLDVEYTVEYVGLDEMAEPLAEELVADPALDLTQDEAEAIVESVFDLEIEAGFAMIEENATLAVGWDVTVDGLADVTDGMVTLVDAADEAGLAGEEFEAQVEAQQAADYSQSFEWDVQFVDDQYTELHASIHSDTENWEAYVAELEDRGVEQEIDMTYEVHGALVGDEIDIEMAVEVNHEDLLEGVITDLLQTAEDDPMVGGEELELWRSIDDAGLEVMAVDVDVADGTTTVEAGASADDMSALQDAVADELGGLSFAHLYADVSDQSETSYVYVDGMVDPDPTEEAVEAHGVVGPDTEVHLGADLSEFPSLDVEEAGEFLGVDASPFEMDSSPGDHAGDGADDADDGTDDSVDDADDADDSVDDPDDEIPGFGAVVALIALLSVALLAHRR